MTIILCQLIINERYRVRKWYTKHKRRCLTPYDTQHITPFNPHISVF